METPYTSERKLSYFERRLFHDGSPAADEYYARSAGHVFEIDPQLSKIEVRIQSSIDVTYYERNQEHGTSCRPVERNRASLVAAAPKEADSADVVPMTSESPEGSSKVNYIGSPETNRSVVLPDSDDTRSLSSNASSTALSTALDQHRGSSPPTYPGPPKLTVLDLDTTNVRDFVKRTKNDFRVFYLRQRHSYSQLQITKPLFEQLREACHVYPRFNEYLVGFGAKTSDSEIGPPPLKFSPLRTSRNGRYHGFGAFCQRSEAVGKRSR